MEVLGRFGTRVLVGPSRKSFLAGWYPPDSAPATLPTERDLETALLSAHLAGRSVDYLRVHDAALTYRALRAAAFVGGEVVVAREGAL